MNYNKNNSKILTIPFAISNLQTNMTRKMTKAGAIEGYGHKELEWLYPPGKKINKFINQNISAEERNFYKAFDEEKVSEIK